MALSDLLAELAKSAAGSPLLVLEVATERRLCATIVAQLLQAKVALAEVAEKAARCLPLIVAIAHPTSVEAIADQLTAVLLLPSSSAFANHAVCPAVAAEPSARRA